MISTEKLLRAALGAFLFVTVSLSVMTQPAEAIEELTVKMDQASLLRLAREADDVIVGNPSVADISARTRKLFVLTGKGYGQTNIIALDENGLVIQEFRVRVQNDDQNVVTFFNGAKRTTWSCLKNCERTLTIGDDEKEFERVSKQITDKLSTADKAVGQSSSSN